MRPQPYQEIERSLKSVGFVLDRSSGSHFIWRNEATGKSVPVPHHRKPLSVGTVLAIYRQAGLR